MLNRAAVAVLPSVGLETFGTVVLEAQAPAAPATASAGVIAPRPTA
ncbi:hypothetical protein [Micrococcus luteus]|nr:hypothetical protein [Micrococcus luteus]